MVGGYRYQIDGVDICIHVDLNGNPDIEVAQRFVPEGTIEDKMNVNAIGQEKISM